MHAREACVLTVVRSPRPLVTEATRKRWKKDEARKREGAKTAGQYNRSIGRERIWRATKNRKGAIKRAWVTASRRYRCRRAVRALQRHSAVPTGSHFEQIFSYRMHDGPFHVCFIIERRRTRVTVGDDCRFVNSRRRFGEPTAVANGTTVCRRTRVFGFFEAQMPF